MAVARARAELAFLRFGSPLGGLPEGLRELLPTYRKKLLRSELGNSRGNLLAVASGSKRRARFDVSPTGFQKDPTPLFIGQMPAFSHRFRAVRTVCRTHVGYRLDRCRFARQAAPLSVTVPMEPERHRPNGARPGSA
jgi:hypothetical protein